MPTNHAVITDPQIHEPKGVAGASSGTLYEANGSGSGVWKKPDASNVTIADANSNFIGTDVEAALNELFAGQVLMTSLFEDVSNPSTILIPIASDMIVDGIQFILGGAITVADATISVSRSDGASMGSQVITQLGSAEGTTFAFTPSGNNTMVFASHKYIKLVSDGASSTTMPLYVLVYGRRN